MIGNLNNVITKISIKVEKKGKAKIEKSKKREKLGWRDPGGLAADIGC